MDTYTFLWRIEANGDFFEQAVQAASLKAAKARWRYYTGLRIRKIALFQVL